MGRGENRLPFLPRFAFSYGVAGRGCRFCRESWRAEGYGAGEGHCRFCRNSRFRFQSAESAEQVRDIADSAGISIPTAESAEFEGEQARGEGEAVADSAGIADSV